MLTLRAAGRAIIVRYTCRLSRTCSGNSFNRMNGRSEEATVKKDEVDKFATINDWWDPQARSARGLHSMNQLRVPLIKDALLKRPLASHHDEVATPLEGYTVLDVGCGAGLLCEVS